MVNQPFPINQTNHCLTIAKPATSSLQPQLADGLAPEAPTTPPQVPRREHRSGKRWVFIGGLGWLVSCLSSG